METYRSRGHRRLDVRTFESKCKTCVWGCRMLVEIVVGQLEPIQEALPVQDILARPQKLAYFINPGHTQSAWPPLDDLGGRGLGGRRCYRSIFNNMKIFIRNISVGLNFYSSRLSAQDPTPQTQACSGQDRERRDSQTYPEV